LYEKGDIEMGFAVTCPLTHKAFLNMQRHIVLQILPEQKDAECD
jgi:hypothetical protein